METIPLIALVAAAIILVLSKLSLGSRARARRALARVKNTPIGDIKDGEWARVTGLVGAVGPLMTSPIGRHPCIGFRLEVHRADDDYSDVLSKEDCGVFSITDDTGRVHVEGRVLVALGVDHDWSMVPTDRFQVLEDAGVKTQGLLRARKFAYREGLLRPGDRVSALGLAFLEPDSGSPAAGLRAPLLSRRLRGSDERPIVLADATRPVRTGWM